MKKWYRLLAAMLILLISAPTSSAQTEIKDNKKSRTIEIQKPVVKPAVKPAVKTQVKPNISIVQLATVTDFDGMQYRITKIGNQWWMMDNLASNHNANGWELIPEWTTWKGTFPYYAGSGSSRIYHWRMILQDNPAGQIGLSGGKRGSDALPSGVQGICPEGWHLPSEGEWLELIELLGGVDHAAPKLRSVIHLDDAIYWTCTEGEGGRVKVIKLVENYENIILLDGSNNSMHHVRCVQD